MPVCSIHDCLQKFVETEQLDDSERFYCKSCKSKQPSTKQFCIRRLPTVLCLHIKRFRCRSKLPFLYLCLADFIQAFPIFVSGGHIVQGPRLTHLLSFRLMAWTCHSICWGICLVPATVMLTLVCMIWLLSLFIMVMGWDQVTELSRDALASKYEITYME